MPNRFRTPALRAAYEEATASYESRHKALFLASGKRRGEHNYSHGSNFSIYFWQGYDGKAMLGKLDRNAKLTPAYAIWCAGRDAAKADGKLFDVKHPIAETEFEGRWREPRGTPKGELIWLSPGKGGLQTYVAMVAGKQVATIRSHSYAEGFNVRVTGWVWSKPLAGSVAEQIAVKETGVKGFTNLRTAKQAVIYALDRLPMAGNM